MIEKIYKNKCMVTCDNCGIGQECDNWADAMDFMNEEGWKKKLADGEWKYYCPECQER
jgi:NADH pyrophosphatase NudC (nudix superfamily)